MSQTIEGFPLFPLGIVLLPGEAVPLHIFEERYKLMIGECLEQDSPFGVLWMSDDGLREVGCTALVTQVLARMDDGRLNVLVQGGEPFRLERRIEDMPYPAGDVELLDEEGDPSPAEADPEAGAEKRELAALGSYGMAATLDFALEAKQDLLELRSEADRLGRLDELFGSTIERLDKAEAAAELSRGNGHLRRAP